MDKYNCFDAQFYLRYRECHRYDNMNSFDAFVVRVE